MQKTAKQSGFGISFHKELSRVEKNTRMLGKEVQELRRTLRLWFSEEGGWLFNKSAARSFANFARAELRSGAAFDMGGKYFQPLSDPWVELKKKRGWHQQEGRATDTLLDNITWHRTGWSEFSVGVKQNVRMPDRVDGYPTGKIKEVHVYGMLIEKGRPAGYRTGKQPPRPWFGTTFLKWVHMTMPDLVNETFAVRLRAHLENLMRAGAEGGYESPENAVSVTTREAAMGGFEQESRLAKSLGRKHHTVHTPKRPDATKVRDLTGREKPPAGERSIDEVGTEIVKVFEKGSQNVKETWIKSTDDQKWYEIAAFYARKGIDIGGDY